MLHALFLTIDIVWSPLSHHLLENYFFFVKTQLLLHTASQNKERFYTNHYLSLGYVLYSLSFLIVLYKLDAARPKTI